MAYHKENLFREELLWKSRNVMGVYMYFLFLGFPLDKAVAYAKLRNPFVINDLNLQYQIQDR